MAYKLVLFTLLISLLFNPFSWADDKTKVEMTYLSLKDVQGLFGGRNIYINSQGMVWVQVVDKNRMEKRFQFQMNPQKLNEINLILSKNNYLKFKTNQRMGVPDEAYPVLKVLLTTGEINEVGKWAGDEHPQFDAIYNWLILKVVPPYQSKTIYEGSYQNNWSPPGFKI